MKDLNVFEKGVLGVFGLAIVIALYMTYMSSAGASIDTIRFNQVVLVALGAVLVFIISFINSCIWDNLCHRDIKIYTVVWLLMFAVCFILHRENLIDLNVLLTNTVDFVVISSLSITKWLTITLLGGV